MKSLVFLYTLKKKPLFNLKSCKMKKQFLISAAIFFLILNMAFATVRTVSNDTAGGAQYNSLHNAYNAANNGDTLLVEGTNLNYGVDNGCNQFWNKNLMVIGAGI